MEESKTTWNRHNPKTIFEVSGEIFLLASLHNNSTSFSFTWTNKTKQRLKTSTDVIQFSTPGLSSSVEPFPLTREGMFFQSVPAQTAHGTGMQLRHLSSGQHHLLPFRSLHCPLFWRLMGSWHSLLHVSPWHSLSCSPSGCTLYLEVPLVL